MVVVMTDTKKGKIRKPNPYKFDRQIAEQMVQEGKHYSEIAKRLNMHPESVRRRLHKEGLFVLQSTAHKSAQQGIEKARKYFESRGWTVAEKQHPCEYDFVTPTFGINVKHGAYKIDIEQSNLDRCKIGTVFLCFIDNKVYVLQLTGKETL